MNVIDIWAKFDGSMVRVHVGKAPTGSMLMKSAIVPVVIAVTALSVIV